MLSKLTTPKSKSELIKSIQSIPNPKIEVIDVFDRSDKQKLNQHFDKMIVKGHFSVIFLRSEK